MGGMSDHRYKRTEEKFLAVFFDNPNCTMRQLADKAGIAYSTVYTHHHSILEIIPDCEKNILAEYELVIEKRMKNEKIGLKMLCLEMLIFMVKNQQIFGIFVKFGNRGVVMEMILKLGPKITVSDRVLRICAAEITEVIFEWGERGFSENEIGKVLADIMYLADTCGERLGFLA